jgi:hypothetical protein
LALGLVSARSRKPSDYLIREVRKIAELPSAEEMQQRLRQRDPN